VGGRGILFFATTYLGLLRFALLYIGLYLLPHITLQLDYLPLLNCLVLFSELSPDEKDPKAPFPILIDPLTCLTVRVVAAGIKTPPESKRRCATSEKRDGGQPRRWWKLLLSAAGAREAAVGP
jgi:hypothetical protein